MWDRPQLLIATSNLLLAVAALLVFYAVLYVLIRLPVFPLRHVDVQGHMAHVTRDQVQQLVRTELRGNFFTLDLEAARLKFQRLPWVRKAQLRRVWPDRLDVALEEHVAMASWGEGVLVNTHGETFAAERPKGLAEFVGPSGTEMEVSLRYAVMREQLAAIGLTPQRIVLSPRRAWQVRLSDGTVVELGREQRAEQVNQRMARLVGLYKAMLGRVHGPVQYVDFRYPNGFAVKLPGAQAAPPARRGEPG